MATAETGLMTAEEFYEFVHRPENADRFFELERGEVVEITGPGKRHGFVCANVVAVIGNYAQQRRKGYVCSNGTGIIVEREPDTVRGPDVMLFEDAERVEDIDRSYGELPPRLAVEVLSPSDTFGRLMPRVTEQLQFGTPLIWVIDPDARNVTVFRPGAEPYVVAEAVELDGNNVLPDFRCKVAEFFALPGR